MEQKRSFVDREIARQARYIHKIRAKDTTGRWAYYFVLVKPYREPAFLKAVHGKADAVIDLLDFGKVIASNYGEEPTEEVLTYLRDKYDLPV